MSSLFSLPAEWCRDINVVCRVLLFSILFMLLHGWFSDAKPNVNTLPPCALLLFRCCAPFVLWTSSSTYHRWRISFGRKSRADPNNNPWPNRNYFSPSSTVCPLVAAAAVARVLTKTTTWTTQPFAAAAAANNNWDMDVRLPFQLYPNNLPCYCLCVCANP